MMDDPPRPPVVKSVASLLRLEFMHQSYASIAMEKTPTSMPRLVLATYNGLTRHHLVGAQQVSLNHAKNSTAYLDR